ncbi:MerR family transcriptional regulator [Dictyobacter kobayashii]|uniref:MerR family transcriptional regulator n=1 Tax=Dictyobacter kobayashii TaxID=2014872 RepID=A0A402AP96_9CHLR|nr:MerR family transcriptional regulator [Dictyobacter kobayashii]GCE20864.1 MerR family transcriptional regulator [Dictyobacter kobayashii]
MKIHELVQQTGLTAPTIRFYEKEGLLDERHLRREANNYRFYYESAIEHLLTLKRLQSAGFTLAELRALFQAKEANDHHKKLELLRQKMEEIDRKQVELRCIQNELNQLYARFIAARRRNKDAGEWH